MTHIATSPRFKENAKAALADPQLQTRARHRRAATSSTRRAEVAAKLPEFEALRDARATSRTTRWRISTSISKHYEQKGARRRAARCIVRATAEDARASMLDICREAGAKTVTKGKSMIGEEIGDQRRISRRTASSRSRPISANTSSSCATRCRRHIIAPAVHLNKRRRSRRISAASTRISTPTAISPSRRSLLAEARGVLRERFLAADVGITGANFLIAETGTSIIVTNEGNGDLTQTLPKVHIVLASIEKIVPTLEDVVADPARAGALGDRAGDVGLHDASRPARAAPAIPTGRTNTTSSFSTTAARRCSAGEFQDMLRCIRCGACMNHCPVYHAVGGHAYGWVYPGPMGAVLTPSLIGIEQGRPPAQRLDLLRALRERLPGAHPAAQADAPLARARVRAASVARRRCAPASRFWALLRQAAGALPARDRHRDAGARAARAATRAASRWLPLAGGWTEYRDFPAPQGATFQAQWKARGRERER